MSRASRGSFFLNSSSPGSDEHTQACTKELLRHYDSTVLFSGIYEDGEYVHASAMGISGILIHRPVMYMGSGDRVKRSTELSVTSLLHEFCSGKIFLVKLLLPHHPAAKDELGPRYDQVSAAAYVKTAGFLVKILRNPNMKDSKDKTPLDRLLIHLADQRTCATSWIPVLEYMLNADAHLSSPNEENSAISLLYSLVEHSFRPKMCRDGCEKNLVRVITQQAEKQTVNIDSLIDIFETKNRCLTEILNSLKK